MKAASVSEIKKELKERSPSELLELCLRLSRFKKENKELLTYLLYEASHEPSYISSVKEEIDLQFSEINNSSYYFIKKSIRKILRNTKKFIRYSLKKETEVELLLYFCEKMKSHEPPVFHNIAMQNLFGRTLFSVGKTIKYLDEDLQYDYGRAIEKLKEQNYI